MSSLGLFCDINVSTEDRSFNWTETEFFPRILGINFVSGPRNVFPKAVII